MSPGWHRVDGRGARQRGSSSPGCHVGAPAEASIIEVAFAEVQDFQRALSGRVDSEFVRLLEEKGVKVHAPTEAEMKAWCQATASVYDETRSYLGGSWVAETRQFRRDWDGGRYARQEADYAERFAKIEVPVEEVLRHFR